MTDAPAAVKGRAAPRFAGARGAFAANFAEGLETGAAFAVEIDGERVVDLWGGAADAETGADWAADTLAPVFSTTKAMTAIALALLVERGALDYERTLASLWPDFAQGGKGGVTVGQALSHQAGLPGFPEKMDPAEWYDREAVAARLAAMAPLWKPGEGSGYHPITFGVLADEIARRAGGAGVADILRRHFAGPFGLDVWIGLPEAEHGRVAALEKPKALPEFGAVTPEKRAAFLTPWAAPGPRGAPQWRKAEFPGANGHATARGLAGLMSVIARGGRLGESAILSARTLEALTRERARGPDRVLPFTLSFGAGLLRNLPGLNVPGDADGFYGPSPSAVGHSGWGGSCAFADPETELSFAYVMNRQSPHLIGDPRPGRLIRAVYEALRS